MNFTRNKQAFKTIQTIKDFVQFAELQLQNSDLYFGHGTDNCYDEAVWMVEFVLSQSNIEFKTINQALKQEQLNQLLALLENRIESKKPLAYLTKQCYFAGLEFFVDERVIIPRSPIAELILSDFSFINTPINNALDLCCGSGCIGLSLAYYHHCNLLLSDICEDALRVATRNYQKINNQAQKELGKSIQAKIIKSDLFENIDNTFKGKFDLIVSNPPYVSNQEYQSLPIEYLAEPKKALIAKNKGLEFAIAIMQNAANYLTDKGYLILEVGNSDLALIKKFPNANLIWLEFKNGGIGVLAISKQELITLFN